MSKLTPEQELELIQIEEDEEADRSEGADKKFRELRTDNPIVAGVRGGLDAMTFGHVDELSGALANPVGAAKALIGKGSDDSDVRDYQAERDVYRRVYDDAKKTYGNAFGIGGVAGAIAGPGKFLAPLKGAKAVGAAGAVGALTGEGMSRAELADKEYGKLAVDTGIGGGVGLAAGYVGNKIGGAIANRAARKAAEKEAASAAAAAKASSEDILPALTATGQPKPNAQQVIEAANDLAPGKPLPGYMTSNSKEVQQLASTVLESPTLAGVAERKSVEPFFNAAKRVGDEVAETASNLDRYEAGGQVRAGIASKFKERLAPLVESYDQLEGQFARLPLNRVAFKRAINAMRREYKTDPSGKAPALLDRLEQTFNDEVKTVGDLRKFRTKLGEYLDPAASGAEQSIYGRMYGVVTRERNRSILAAEQAAKTGRVAGGRFAGPDQKAVEGSLSELVQTDRAYAKLLRETGETLGLKGTRRSTGREVIEKTLDEGTGKVTNEQLAAKLFNAGDRRSLEMLRQRYPEEFQVLAKQRLGEVVSRARAKDGSIDVRALTRELRKQPEHVQQMVLGDLFPKTQKARTLLDAMPEKFNPSETATKWELLQRAAQSPVGTLKDNAAVAGMRARLNNQAPAVQDPSAVIQRVQANPKLQKYVAPLREALSRGENGFAATWFLLQQQHPELRQETKQNE